MRRKSCLFPIGLVIIAIIAAVVFGLYSNSKWAERFLSFQNDPLLSNETEDQLSNIEDFEVDTYPEVDSQDSSNNDQKLRESQSNPKFQTFTSRHGFEISFPKDWQLFETAIEDYKSIKEAQDVSANHLSIVSFNPDEVEGGLPVDNKEIKLEMWLNTDIQDYSLEEWVDAQVSEEMTISRTKMQINGNSAIVVREEGVMVEQTLAVYYLNEGLGVVFIAWPYDTVYEKEFFDVVQSFEVTQ